ncbi:hypothetical protein C1H46_039468 [Malus baccata]|uniref:Uncharacterized protein n=1 Tax=Malus baccata TaxID=106549 RepID=A0A540KLD2_MALBA|nr:hypothetical protein C1H46_039468 [Malus baccata]
MGGSSTNSNHKLEDSEKKSSPALVAPPMIGLRATLTWVFLTISVLYLLYYSNSLLYDRQDCPTTTLDPSTERHLETLSNVATSADLKLGEDDKEDDEESPQVPYDVYGDLLGLLSAHPVTPLVSLHHLDVVEPVFPHMSRVKALHHLSRSVKLDSASIMQQSICYDKDRYWSISVSWGYVVQIVRGIMSPRELETPSRTFLNWYRRADYTAYAFNTRPVSKHPCQKPFIFYLSSTRYDEGRKKIIGYYTRHKSPVPHCRWKMASPEQVDSIVVLKRPDPLRWEKSPRKDCCRILPSQKNSTMYLLVDNCRLGELAVATELHDQMDSSGVLVDAVDSDDELALGDGLAGVGVSEGDFSATFARRWRRTSSVALTRWRCARCATRRLTK